MVKNLHTNQKAHLNSTLFCMNTSGNILPLLKSGEKLVSVLSTATITAWHVLQRPAQCKTLQHLLKLDSLFTRTTSNKLTKGARKGWDAQRDLGRIHNADFKVVLN